MIKTDRPTTGEDYYQFYVHVTMIDSLQGKQCTWMTRILLGRCTGTATGCKALSMCNHCNPWTDFYTNAWRGIGWW